MRCLQVLCVVTSMAFWGVIALLGLKKGEGGGGLGADDNDTSKALFPSKGNIQFFCFGHGKERKSCFRGGFYRS